MRWGTAATAMLCASLFSCGSTEEYENKISYDPNLKPGQIFFNPDANWVRKWEATPPPKVPTQVSVADLKLQAENPRPPEEVAWTVVKPGREPETLPVGTKPAEVLAPPPVVAKKEPEAAPAPAPAVAVASLEAPPASPLAEIAAPAPRASNAKSERVAVRSRGLASNASQSGTRFMRKAHPILTPDVKMPLLNSLAVDSVRFEIYNKMAYSWRPAMVRPAPFRAEDGSLMNAYFFVRRRKESWKNLSRIVYGTTRMHKKLRAWNGDVPLKVGTVLYYASQLRPEDEKELLPIVLDKGGEFAFAKPKRGEALSLMAKRIYGEWRVWREIAYFNDIADPHELPKGADLRIQPVDLSRVSPASSSSLRTPAGTGNGHE